MLERFLDHAGEGNIEYLGYLRKGPGTEKTFDLQALVEQSHSEIKE